jgi:hypothetical protein
MREWIQYCRRKMKIIRSYWVISRKMKQAERDKSRIKKYGEGVRRKRSKRGVEQE